MKNIYYLDNNATTKVDPSVFEAMKPYFTELYGNASSMYTFGGQVGKKIAEARQSVADLIGAIPQEIIFTACGTESDNTAIFSAINADTSKKHIITTRVEHPAVQNTFLFLEKKGYSVTWLGVDADGNLNLDELAQAIRKDTALVSTMYANSETGVIFPVSKIAALCKERGVLYHVDAVQAVGKIAIDLSTLPIDYLALSGHKIHAPKGIGVLFVRKGVPFTPFMIGGHQERGRRAGTENVPYIVGLGQACKLAQKNIAIENSKVKELRDMLEQGILAAVPDTIINGGRADRLPNTTYISFKYVEGEAILLLLDQLGICASSGSACTSGSLEPSHVLRAMGVPFTYAHGSIRFSLSCYNTKEEVEYVLKHLPPIIERLRAISPFRGDEKTACTIAAKAD